MKLHWAVDFGLDVDVEEDGSPNFSKGQTLEGRAPLTSLGRHCRLFFTEDASGLIFVIGNVSIF